MVSSRATGLEVIRNALDSVTDVMSVTLVHTARSPIVRNGWDFSCAILSAQGELVGQGLSQPVHLAGMMPALRSCMDRYEGRIYPGDILANNDPYEGGSHLPDIYLFQPVFVEGVLVVYLATMAHHVDIGGRVAGGQGHDNTEIYQEGLRIPPLKLYDGGEPNETLFRLLEKAVRTPDLVMADFQAQVAAIRVGEGEILRVIGKYGVEAFKGDVEELLDYTERLTRQGIRAMPDGSWSFTDYLDNAGLDDETIAITANLTKKDDELHVDFTDTSPQGKGSILGVLSTNRGMVFVVIKSLLGIDIPNTSGLLRPITITAPEGCAVNPLMPAAVAARGIGLRVIGHAIWGAVAQMTPERVFACPGGSIASVTMSGYDGSQTLPKAWILMDATMMEIAMGGRFDKDGIDAQCTNITQLANIPAEIIDAELPFSIEEHALIPDTEGAGKFRGGLGMARQWRYKMDETTVQVVSERSKRPPWGLFGGGSGQAPKVIVNPGKGQRMMPPKCTFVVNRGDTLRMEISGAGGYGDPLGRDPKRVLEDIIEEKVTPQRARDVYGVVVNPEGRTVDWEATLKLRHEMKR